MIKPKKNILVIITVVGIAALLFSIKYKTFEQPLNEIKTIKYFEPAEQTYTYNPLVLTVTKYYSTPFAQTVTAKAIYKGKVIGLKITAKSFSDKLIIKSIGQESDNFVEAIAELYDEKSGTNSMKKKITGSYLNFGLQNWYKESILYKAAITTDIFFGIDLSKQQITIGDRRYGVNKKSFVNAFKQ